MISPSNRDSCSELVAGNYDVIIDEPTTSRTVMTDFLRRFQQLEAELVNPQDCSYVNEFKLLKEFSRLLKEDKSNLTEGESDFNTKKNRYKDIIPFSHTRVILNSNPDVPGSCYINANYIRGPSGSQKAYIACQGPLSCTLDDFWRMIWECNVSVVVMACNQHESGKPKCELYWPQELEATTSYGNIQVTLLRVRQICPDFLIRKFSVKYTHPTAQKSSNENLVSDNNQQASGDKTINNNYINNDNLHTVDLNPVDLNDTETPKTDEQADQRPIIPDERYQKKGPVVERIICQFHYTTWPDHGAPSSVQPILELVRLIREVQPDEDKPILVHCSAGCGRTGTICCIDYVWGLLKSDKLDSRFDLCNIISDMRQQRMAMVQTLEQYILCHRAVAALFIQKLKTIEADDSQAFASIKPEDESDEVFDETGGFGPVFI